MLKSSLLTDSLVRAKLFVGFGAEVEEWANVKKSSAGALRATGAFRMSYIEGWRSCPLHPVVSLITRRGEMKQSTTIPIFTDIQRKIHDIRGRRCLHNPV
ncbi:unnamed protein product [Malus baccata var. baccata]